MFIYNTFAYYINQYLVQLVSVIVSLLNRKEGSPCVVTVTDTTPFLAKHVKEKLGCHTGI